jgi:hypothetical protein
MADMDTHRPVTTRHMTGALRPAQVTPYCPRCNVPWPCPTGASSPAPGVNDQEENHDATP